MMEVDNLEELEEEFNKIKSKYDKVKGNPFDFITPSPEQYYALCKGLYLQRYIRCPLSETCKYCIAERWEDCNIVDMWYKDNIYNKEKEE